VRERSAVNTFERLVEPHRGEIRRHCGRMLRSPHDADDAVQEAMIRAWRGLDRFEGRASPRSWLHRIATNVCLDMIARRRPCIPVEEPQISKLATEEPGPAGDAERRQLTKMVLTATLEPLPERQLAVLVLRDVLGFSAREAAERLQVTVAAANSALQRARAAVAERARRMPDQAEISEDRPPPEVVTRLLELFETGDVSGMMRAVAPA
jgi:RNA polymerase sigma factor (sigma-70 family)